MPLITTDRLYRFAPSARADVVAAIVAAGDAFATAGLTTPLRVAHFLSQTAVETGGFRKLEEDLAYSAQRLHQVWPRRFPTLASAAPYAHKSEALANKIYGGRLGNSDEGDGWRYRGSGMLQTTGRDNFEASGFADNPDALRSPGPALQSALEFWSDHACNHFADADDCEGLTRKINGGLNGLADRRAYLRKAKGIFRAAPSFSGAVGFADLGQGIDDAPQAIVDDATTLHVQTRLRDLGYYEVGTADKDLGPRAQGAILAFRNDNGLPLTPVIDSDLIAALPGAHPRLVSPARATGMPADSRIVGNANTLVGGAAVTGGASLLSQIGGSIDTSAWLDKVETYRGTAGRVKALVEPIRPYLTLPIVCLIAAIAVGIIAWRIKAARIDDHRTGATP